MSLESEYQGVSKVIVLNQLKRNVHLKKNLKSRY